MSELNLQITDPWQLQILKLARPLTQYYFDCLKSGDLSPVKKMFRDYDSPAEVLSWCHGYLVNAGNLVSIKNAALPVKNEFWDEAKQWAPGAGQRKTKLIARAIYTMAFIIQNDLLNPQNTTTK